MAISDHSSLRWFEAGSCKLAPRGPPSSFVQPRGALYIQSFSLEGIYKLHYKRKISSAPVLPFGFKILKIYVYIVNLPHMGI